MHQLMEHLIVEKAYQPKTWCICFGGYIGAAVFDTRLETLGRYFYLLYGDLTTRRGKVYIFLDEIQRN